MMRVLEFKHVGPRDGCFWRWEYLGCDADGVYPIVFTPRHLSPYEIVDLASGTELPDPASPVGSMLCARLFKDFTWLEWGQELFDEIPYGYFPEFWAFAQEAGLEFIWECSECREPQTDEPIYPSDYRGNGGAGIEVLGWLCADCAYEEDQNDNS